ncbi:myb-like protein X isoform X1 [Thunnus albacares]|uniref:myb-like protein X isoform X1 n=1 Tax=Thunnus albacares TaxID=8236 RepID=UPI001CF68E69|nr:myb-like protein X isoform X1 [Thunnus albacares]
MERKRTRLSLSSSEEEDRDRRSSQRFRKRVRYFEDDEQKEEEVEEEDEEEDEEEENEQPGPSTQNTHNQRTQENRFLHVTCGNKKGILDVGKLDRGKECIECEGRWFSPPAFEDFGGKGPSKKWKTSIFYDNKPLQFWFEQGSLTTKGFKRRRTETAKHKKILSSDHESGSLSEESEISLQSGEGNEEDDVKDEDWHPGSEELAPETEEEEERVGTEKGGEVVEEEDKLEKGEMEDEDIPVVADNDSDNDAFEGSETKLIISAAKKSALQMKLQVLIERLPEVRRDCQSNCTDHPVIANFFTVDAQSEEKRGCNASAKNDTSVTSAGHIDPTQIPEPPVVGGIKEENGEELSENIKSEEHGQREIKTEAVNFPSSTTSSPEIKPADIIDNLQGTEVGESEMGHCEEKEEEWRRRAMGPEMQRQLTEHFEDCDSADTEHFYMPPFEASGQAFANENANTTSIGGFKEESIEATSVGPPTIHVNVLVGENSDITTSGVAQLQEMAQEKRCPQTVQASDMLEGPSSGPSAGFNLDTMDLDQLKREKIKMQLKVLKLQEEYYTLQIKKFKQ